MLKHKKLIQFLLVALLTIAAGCSSNTNDGGFDDGHEWIMPNPPAEFNLQIVDEANQPIGHASVFIYLEDEKLDENSSFIDYAGEMGYTADGDGRVAIVYLGDQGGGYEVSANGSDPAELFLVVEAAEYKSQTLNVVDYLFRSEHQTGREERTVNGQTLELRIVEDIIILQN